MTGVGEPMPEGACAACRMVSITSRMSDTISTRDGSRMLGTEKPMAAIGAYARSDTELITAHLADGRTISVPLAWSWRLSDARPDQRARYEIIGDGTGIHWPDVDEHISVRGLLEGTPARRPPHRK